MVTSNEHDLQDLMHKFPQNIRAAQQLLYGKKERLTLLSLLCVQNVTLFIVMKIV